MPILFFSASVDSLNPRKKNTQKQKCISTKYRQINKPQKNNFVNKI
jgi:hypothetical protein